jgi:UDP-N-acetylglucosamine 3-dehydrogenase
MSLRVGILGLGVMGRNHARVLSNISEVNLVALYDLASDPEERLFGLPICSNLEVFFAQKLDYVVISAPTFAHHELGMEVAARGIHALIEKPIASTVKEGEELVEAFQSRNLTAAVGHIDRFNPALKALKLKIREGLIGEIIQISTRRQGPFPGRISDVGVVKDLATHDIDIATWVGGSSYADVSSRIAHKSGRAHEDVLLAVGSLKNGVIVSHMVNWLSPFKERNTAVLGDKGLLVADTLGVDLVFSQNGKVVSSWDVQTQFRGVSEGDTHKFALERREPLRAEHEEFIAALNGAEKNQLATLKEGLEVLRIAEVMVSRKSGL